MKQEAVITERVHEIDLNELKEEFAVMTKVFIGVLADPRYDWSDKQKGIMEMHWLHCETRIENIEKALQ